jgi:hypothetical protein
VAIKFSLLNETSQTISTDSRSSPNYTQLLVTSVSNGSGEALALSDADKKVKLDGFHTGLKPKGLASTPKTLGSRVRMAAAAKAKRAADKNKAS